MQTNIMKYILTIGALFLLAACGNKSKDANAALLEAKKTELQKLKDQEKGLEDQIAKLDTSRVEKPKLVVLTPITPQTFTHYIDLQGKVESDNISYVAPRGAGGQVRAIYIKKGDMVHKGQLLIKLDDAIALKAVEQSEQGMNALKSQASLTASIYDRRKNLWDQKIGTELDLLKAKTDMEYAQAQVNSMAQQVKQAQQQVTFTNVTSDVDGQVEMVNVRPGEYFSPATASGQLQIVNTSNLKVTAQVPENYAGRVRPGSDIKISLPDINKTVDAKVRVAGTAIDPVSHSFFIEAKLSPDRQIRPNQVALVKVRDYTVSNAITVPVNTLQNDEKGKYVMVAVKDNGKLLARKRMVTSGEFYGDNLEIKNGLQMGDMVITDGFQSLYDGQLLTTK